MKEEMKMQTREITCLEEVKRDLEEDLDRSRAELEKA